MMRHAFILCLLIGLMKGDECPPDDSCNAHRICEFGSLEAYDVEFGALLDAAGCSRACVNQCECSSCNTSGPIWEALTEDNVQYCSLNVICQSPALRRAMNYPATEFLCDSVYAIAVRSLYQLCATTPQGQCRNGACTTEDCVPQVGNACDQTSGIGRVAALIVTLLAMVGTVYFMWAYSGIDIIANIITDYTLIDASEKNHIKQEDTSDWM